MNKEYNAEDTNTDPLGSIIILCRLVNCICQDRKLSVYPAYTVNRTSLHNPSTTAQFNTEYSIVVVMSYVYIYIYIYIYI